MGFGLTGIGPGEWLVLLGAVLVLFGSKRLPEITRQVGRTLGELRKASNEFRDQITMADYEINNPPPDMEPVNYEDIDYDADYPGAGVEPCHAGEEEVIEGETSEPGSDEEESSRDGK